MGKIILCIILWVLSTGICLAEGFELTDVIQQARDMQMRQTIKDDVQKQIKEVKNTQTPLPQVNEQTAEEKINPEEVLKDK